MMEFQCTGCGITGQTLLFTGDAYVCARCRQGDFNPTSELIDAPPMPTSEIESIKVTMMQTGWVWEGE